jgi:cytochrome c oxidase subunit II
MHGLFENHGIRFEYPADRVRSNRLVLPEGRPVEFRIKSEDVIHSFFLPNLRFKQDAVPGMQIPAWLEATKTGEYGIACAELCGLGHYRMKASMTVHTEADFMKWQQEQATLAAAGGQH